MKVNDHDKVQEKDFFIWAAITHWQTDLGSDFLTKVSQVCIADLLFLQDTSYYKLHRV